MKKSLPLVIYLYIITIFLSGSINAQKSTILRIDPQTAYGASATEYFTEIEYIPLETTKESLFGAAVGFVITDSSFIINDFDTKSVLFFNYHGKFLKKVKWNSNSPVGIFYDKDSCRVELSHFSANEGIKIICYSMTGEKQNLLSVISSKNRFKQVSLFNNHKIECLPFLMPFGGEIIDSTANIMNIYKNDSLIKSVYPFNPKQNFLMVKKFNFFILNPQLNQSEFAYITIPVKNEVLKVSKDTILPAYKFIFPASYTIPKSELNISSEVDYEKYTAGINNIPNNYVYSIYNFFENKDHIFFRFETSKTERSSGTGTDYLTNFVYNTKTNKLSTLERITSDNKSYYLPVSTSKLRSTGLYFHNNYIYTTASSLEMFGAYEKNKSKKPQYPPALQTYFATQNRKSNPVIVRMKLKE